MTASLVHILLGLLLFLIPVGALYWLDRALLRTFLISLGRMGVQLAALCLVVWLLFRYDRLWLSLLWLVVASLAAGGVVLRRMGQPLLPRLPLVAAGLFLSVLLAGGWLLALSLPGASLAGARWFVPVMALLLSHTMIMCVRGLSAYDAALSSDRQQLEFLLGNGASRLQAHLPFVRRALQAVLAPTAANLSALALFTVPLLLCGLLLGGLPPLQGLVVMLLLVGGCVGASVLALLFILWLMVRFKFN